MFVSSVRDLRFYQNDAATAAVQIKEEEKNRNAEQKRRGTTLTKVVSSLSPSPTHQGLQHWRRAMQPVVVSSARRQDLWEAGGVAIEGVAVEGG